MYYVPVLVLQLQFILFVFCTVPGKFFCHFKNFHDKDLLGADAVHRPILQYCIPIILLLELLTIDNYPRMRKRNKIYYIQHIK